ncbi:MAG TPA: hypothetical protein VG186_12700 [Solirubrobacteraceae bacterium]|nr:hypothetical protein [Solirubrobacteraceae bacterium]
MSTETVTTSPPSAIDSAAPLCAVDRLTVRHHPETLELEVTKRVDRLDPYMEGHFPGFTVYPGVFVLESVLQGTAAALGRPLALAAVHSMRFTAPLLDGDVLIVAATVAPADGPGPFTVEATCRRGDGATAARLKLELELEGDD